MVEVYPPTVHLGLLVRAHQTRRVRSAPGAPALVLDVALENVVVDFSLGCCRGEAQDVVCLGRELVQHLALEPEGEE